MLLTPDAVDVGALAGMDAIAFGCPAMGSEVLEECEFEPMFSGCKKPSGRPRVWACSALRLGRRTVDA